MKQVESFQPKSSFEFHKNLANSYLNISDLTLH